MPYVYGRVICGLWVFGCWFLVVGWRESGGNAPDTGACWFLVFGFWYYC